MAASSDTRIPDATAGTVGTAQLHERDVTSIARSPRDEPDPLIGRIASSNATANQGTTAYHDIIGALAEIKEVVNQLKVNVDTSTDIAREVDYASEIEARVESLENKLCAYVKTREPCSCARVIRSESYKASVGPRSSFSPTGDVSSSFKSSKMNDLDLKTTIYMPELTNRSKSCWQLSSTRLRLLKVRHPLEALVAFSISDRVNFLSMPFTLTKDFIPFQMILTCFSIAVLILIAAEEPSSPRTLSIKAGQCVFTNSSSSFGIECFRGPAILRVTNDQRLFDEFYREKFKDGGDDPQLESSGSSSDTDSGVALVISRPANTSTRGEAI